MMKRIRLGELLIEKNLIDQETFNKAIEIQKTTADKLGKILISMGVIQEEELLKFLAEQLKVEYVDLNHFEINAHLVQLLPETYARRYRAIVLEKEKNALHVGMADPLDIQGFDAISKILKQPIKMAVVSEISLLGIIDKIYRHTQEISHFAKELSGEMIDELVGIDDLFDETIENDEQAPVVKLLNSLFKDAVQARASDIHIEPDEKTLRIRFRIDGLLSENVLDDKRILNAMIQRLKLRANLDISERRLPQDGRFHFVLKGHSYDVRLSTMPTAFGESVVMRLLDQTSSISDLHQLGLPQDMISRIEVLYGKPYGMLLITGPTGSGKTTTLYSILSRLNTPERKIITVEDPVEYRIHRVNQVQVNTKIDLSFARVLRSMLRQDPDVIMVGEIRDTETAKIAMRAAVTGHFVLATLHTNDAISSAMRLIDMGAEGYMVAAAVKGIMGQRLIRKICKHCSKAHTPDETERIWLESMKAAPDASYRQGRGCSHCSQSGYRGRMGIYELLELDPSMLNALRSNHAAEFTKAALASTTYHPMAQQVMTLVTQGETSVYEAIRVIGQLDEEFQTCESAA